VGEGACECEAVGALFGVQAEHEEGGVVFEGEELEGCEVFVSMGLEGKSGVELYWTYMRRRRRGGCHSSW